MTSTAPCSHIAVACAHRGKGRSGKASTRAPRGRVPDAEIAALREVRFSTAMRLRPRSGRSVREPVNQVLAELQITAAPESAVRHALEQVTEETKGLLERPTRRRTRSPAARGPRPTTGSRARRRRRSSCTTRPNRRPASCATTPPMRPAKCAGGRQRGPRSPRGRAARGTRDSRGRRDARPRLEADAQTISEERARLISELRELVRRLGEFADGPQAAIRARRRRRPPRIHQTDSTAAFRPRRGSRLTNPRFRLRLRCERVHQKAAGARWARTAGAAPGRPNPKQGAWLREFALECVPRNDGLWKTLSKAHCRADVAYVGKASTASTRRCWVRAAGRLAGIGSVRGPDAAME